MKKFYVIVAAMAIGHMGFAQGKQSLAAKPVANNHTPSSAAVLTPTDTLWGNLMNWTQPSLIGSVNGGYVVGNNGYDDKQKAQTFINTTPLNVEGAIYWFGAKEVTSGSSTSAVKMRVYSMNGTGTSTQGNVAAPNTVLKSDNVAITMVDTSSSLATPYIHTFSSPVWVTGDFAVGFDVTALAAGDTIGLVHSADGDAAGSELAWEQWSDNTWHTFYDPNNWDLDIDLAIFPIVEMNTSIEEQGFINGIKLATNQPNPFNGTTVISYELANATENVSFMVFDATGRVVKNISVGDKAAGKYTIELSSEGLAAGTYYYTLKAGKSGISKKMIVTQ
jgi:hypothetical protein